MKLIFRLVVVLTFFSPPAFARMAERMADRPGAIESYLSENGKYEVSIKHGEHLPSWSFKENGRQLWSEPLLEPVLRYQNNLANDQLPKLDRASKIRRVPLRRGRFRRRDRNYLFDPAS